MAVHFNSTKERIKFLQGKFNVVEPKEAKEETVIEEAVVEEAVVEVKDEPIEETKKKDTKKTVSKGKKKDGEVQAE